MGEGIDALDGEHGPFQGGHAVGGDGHHHELEHRFLADFVPGAAQGEQAVEHAAPGGRDEHDGEDHAERLRPVGQGGVEQVVRAGPDVDEDQAPEMNDREPVAEHRPVGGFGQEVIHQPEVRRGEEEGDGVMAIPPLDEGILHAGIDRVALESAGRHFQRVEDVQHGDGDRGGDVEPDGHVHVLFAALEDRAEQVDRERHPNDGDGDVDGPLQFGVFLAGGQAERQGDRRRNDDRLPPPEIEPAQGVAEHARLAEPLQRIINAAEHAVADEGEDHGVGVQRADAAEGGEGRVQVQLRPEQLAGGQQAGGGADQAPDRGGDGEGPDDVVVVGECFEWPGALHDSGLLDWQPSNASASALMIGVRFWFSSVCLYRCWHGLLIGQNAQ